MTIEKVEGGFTGYDITCDNCGESEYLDIEWENPFSAVVAEAKELGWKSVRVNGEWEHRCPRCQEKS